MAWFSYRKAGLCGVLILCTVLHSFTVFAAENRDDYRLVFDADYYYNEYPDLQETGEDPAQKEEVQESESPENEIVGPARDLVKTDTE